MTMENPQLFAGMHVHDSVDRDSIASLYTGIPEVARELFAR